MADMKTCLGLHTGAKKFTAAQIKALFDKATALAPEGAEPANIHYAQAAQALMADTQAKLDKHVAGVNEKAAKEAAAEAEKAAAEKKAAEDKLAEERKARAEARKEKIKKLVPKKEKPAAEVTPEDISKATDGMEAGTKEDASVSKKGVNKPVDKARQGALVRWFSHRDPTVDKEGNTIDKGVDGHTDNVKTTLGAPAVALLNKIDQLTSARDKLLTIFASGRYYEQDKNGNWRRQMIARIKQTVFTKGKEDTIGAVENFYQERRDELAKVSGQLADSFAKLEQELGYNNIQAAQQTSKSNKGTAKTESPGKQEQAATLFSSAFRDWKAGDLSAEKPMGAASAKDIRERRELGTLKDSKLSDVYHNGFKFGTTWHGAEAVLMKLRFHGQNPFAAHIASRLYELFKDAKKDDPEFQLPTIKFYSEGALQVYNKNGNMTLDESQKAPHPLGMYDASTNTIHIGPQGQNAQVVLHEILHAALAGYIEKNFDKPVIQAFETLRKHVVSQFKSKPELLDLLHTDKAEAQKLLDAISAPNTGVQEFLSFGLTHGGLQSAMEAMPASRSKSVTGFVKDTWNGFVTLVSKILGLPHDGKQALNQFLHVSGEMLTTGYVDQYTGKQLEAKTTSKKAKTGYEKVAAFWQALTRGTAGNLFRVAKMDDSYGKPKRSYTMEEIFAQHLPEGFTAEKTNPEKMGMWQRTPEHGGAKIVNGWTVYGPNETKAENAMEILEDANGHVTLSTPGSTAGKSAGWRVLQSALAYAFYNGKTFVNEDNGQGMSDRAVARYTEAMMSSALKFGTTDFMEPSRRQLDPSNVTEDDNSTANFHETATAENANLQGWQSKGDPKTTVESRFTHNLNLMAAMTSKLAIAEKPELAKHEFTFDGGFFAPNGEKASGLSTSDMRTIITNQIAGISAGNAQGQSAAANMLDSEDTAKLGIANFLYATTTSAPNAGGLPLNHGVLQATPIDYTANASKTALLEPLFRSLLPTLYGTNATHMKAAGDWVNKMKSELAKRDPRIAAWLGKVYAGFNTGPEIERFIEVFKTGRNAPTTSAHEFGRWVESAKPADIMAALDYMDAYDTNKNAATTLDAHVQVKVRDALAALRTALAATTDAAIQKDFALLKPSEMLTHALQAENVMGQGFGARAEKLLSGTRESINRTSIVSPPGPGGISELGKFHPVRGSDGSLKQMVHSSMVSQFKPAAGETLDTNQVYFYLRKNAATGDYTFRRQGTARELLGQDEAGRKISTSFLNTVSILSNSVATRKLTHDVAAYGPTAGVVFADNAALLKHLNANLPANAQKASVQVFKLSDTESKSAAITSEMRKPGSWVQLPTTAAYGDLAGKVVSGPVWTRISDALNRTALIDSQLYNGMIRTFKGVKTKYSPATMATNIMGNFTLGYLNDVSWTAQKNGLQLYLKYKLRPGTLTADELRIMSAFHASGATLGDYSTNEVKQLMYEAMAAKSESSGVSFVDELADRFKYHGSLAEKAAQMAAKTGRSVDDIMGDVYATGDNMFRLAAFMSKMGELQKTNPNMPYADMQEAAGIHAKKAFLDYDNDARAMHFLRQSALPFVSWTYAFSGVLAKVVKEQPWKLATLALTYSMISAALSAGDTDEDRKRRQRAGKDDTTWFGAYKEWKIGSHNGQDVYFNAAKWFMPTPLEFKDAPNGFAGFHSFPSALVPSNPILNSTMYLFGFDPYTGKTFTKETNTSVENLTLEAAKIYNQFTPPVAGLDSAGTPKILGAKPDLTGAAGDQLAHYARMFAAPVTSVSDEATRQTLKLDIKHVEAAFDKEIASQKRAGHTGKISQSEAQAAIATLKARKAEQVNKLKQEK